MVMHPFEALAEPVRRRIVDILASGEHVSGEIAVAINAEFRISRTAVSQHLRVLRDAGLVDVRADDRWRWYRLAGNGLELLEAEVAELRYKFERAVGWDADNECEYDPLNQLPVPPLRGPGRPHVRARRGRQTEFLPTVDPAHGFFPTATPDRAS